MAELDLNRVAEAKESIATELCAAAALGDIALLETYIADGASVGWRVAIVAPCGHADMAHAQPVAPGSPLPVPLQIDQGDYDGRTAIHLAASEGVLPTVTWLIEQGALHSPVDRWGGTPLDDAVRGRHSEVAEFLRGQGAHAGKSSNADAVTLCSTAARGDVDGLREHVLSRGLGANTCDYDSRTAMHLAASEGHVAVLRFLVEEGGADLNPVDRRGHTPIDDAMREKQEDAIVFLRQSGARGQRRPSIPGLTVPAELLTMTLGGGSPKLQRFSPFRSKRVAGATAPAAAPAASSLATPNASVRSGTVWEAAGSQKAPSPGLARRPSALAGWAPGRRRGDRPGPKLRRITGSWSLSPAATTVRQLCAAAANGDIDAMQKLLARGVPVDSSDYDHRTPLHLAASEGLLPVVVFLIEDAGAEHSPTDRWGGTPLDDTVRSTQEWMQRSRRQALEGGNGEGGGAGAAEARPADGGEVAESFGRDVMAYLRSRGARRGLAAKDEASMLCAAGWQKLHGHRATTPPPHRRTCLLRRLTPLLLSTGAIGNTSSGRLGLRRQPQ